MNRFVGTFLVLACWACVSSHVGAFSGDLGNAIFVDTATGSDLYPGTMAQPKATISGALAITTSDKNIYVSKGTYSEDVHMASGVSLYGQYDQASSWTQDAANTTTVTGSTNPVTFASVSGETHFEGFQVQSANTPIVGQSSYAVRIDSSPGPLFIRYNTLIAGTGGAGDSGINSGVAGADGRDGSAGFAGYCDDLFFVPGGPGGTSTCAAVGGDGGTGGEGKAAGKSGGGGTGNTAGGFGGDWGNPGSAGGAGSAGANGANGANATPASSAVGSIAMGLYMPVTTTPGGSGTNGNSGGGGGGGGGQDNFIVIDGTGNGGGGGGAGGCGAAFGGTSGTGGGGSFALFVASASVVTLDANYLVISQAGAGGKGGNGANGGVGGKAGAGATDCSTSADDEVGAGGNGGKGGNGGNSGAGAGGPGGPAIAIFDPSGSVTLGTNRFSLPGTAPAGSGGSGGSGGLVGIVQHDYPNDVTDPGPAMLAITDTSILTSYTGFNYVNVPVSLGPVTNAYVTVHYQTVDGTAVAGTNYTATSGDLHIAPWATAQAIRVQVLGALSLPKTFSVQLSASTNAGITTSSAAVTINYFSDIIFRNAFD